MPVGSLSRNEKIALPSRHLGLRLAAETLSPALLTAMADWVESQLDLGAVLQLAQSAAPSRDQTHLAEMTEEARSMGVSVPESSAPPRLQSPVRIAIARDPAFCFYYEDNLDLLRESGAELVEFSPVADGALPAVIAGLYLGGGYPELHAARLSQNRSMLAAVRDFAHSGAPVYAECGGFMYLTEAIADGAGIEHPLVGLFPTRARMQLRLAALHYLEAEASEDALWLRAGDRLRGHEFRYSEIDAMPPEIPRCLNGCYRAGSVLAGYPHLHFRSCPDFGARFVEACRNRKSIL
jgi:cobyrinic acid a,c-diamide synthase